MQVNMYMYIHKVMYDNLFYPVGHLGVVAPLTQREVECQVMRGHVFF